MEKSFHMPIQLKITLLSFGIVVFSIIIGGIFLIGNSWSSAEKQLGKQSLVTAHSIAESAKVQELILEPNGWEKLNPIIEKLRIIHDADYIVVLNNQHIRYSHPLYSQLGTFSKSSDENAAFADMNIRPKLKGELGIAVRAFVPILNHKNEQIGVVLVGNILPTLSEIVENFKTEIRYILTANTTIWSLWFMDDGQAYKKGNIRTRAT